MISVCCSWVTTSIYVCKYVCDKLSWDCGHQAPADVSDDNDVMKCLEFEGISVWQDISDISDLHVCCRVVLSVDFNVCDNFNIHASDKLSWLDVSRVIVIWSTSCQKIVRKIRIIECEVFTVKVYLIVSVSVWCGVVLWWILCTCEHNELKTEGIYHGLAKWISIVDWLRHCRSLSSADLINVHSCPEAKWQFIGLFDRSTDSSWIYLYNKQQINSSLSIFYGTVKPGILSIRK